MIKDKKQPDTATTPASNKTPKVSIPEEVTKNPFAEMYYAVKRALLTVRENPEDPTSSPFFKTIAIDNGQYLRIIRDTNLEMEVAFPAIFVHFVNVRYLVQQQRIGEGRLPMTQIKSVNHSRYSNASMLLFKMPRIESLRLTNAAT